MDRWQDKIHGAVYRILWDREIARDITQEAFLKAYTKLGSFAGGAAFGTWLHAIAINLCRSELRRRGAAKNKQPLSLDAIGSGAGGGSSDPDRRGFDPEDDAPGAVERLATEEHCEIVREEIERLDPTFREVLVMREFQDMSYEEIAEVTGVALGTVRSRLHRARRDLREQLKERVL